MSDRYNIGRKANQQEHTQKRFFAYKTHNAADIAPTAGQKCLKYKRLWTYVNP